MSVFRNYVTKYFQKMERPERAARFCIRAGFCSGSGQTCIIEVPQIPYSLPCIVVCVHTLSQMPCLLPHVASCWHSFR